MQIHPLFADLAAGRSVSNGRLSALADLEPGSLGQLAESWAAIPAHVRLEVVERADEMATEDYTLDFTALDALALRDPDPLVRARAARSSRDGSDRRTAARLVEMLADGDLGVRIAAADGLGDFNLAAEFGQLDEAAGEAVAARLRPLAEGGAEPQLRAAALVSIASRSLPWVAAAIIRAYDSDVDSLRLAAIRAMGRSASERWLDTLFDEMESPDPAFRAEAADACGEISSTDAIDRLASLLDDDDQLVVAAAVSALGETGGSEAARILRGFAERAPEDLDDLVAASIEVAEMMAGLGEDDD